MLPIFRESQPEPGCYVTKKFGIRIESIVIVREQKPFSIFGDHIKSLCFEHITWVATNLLFISIRRCLNPFLSVSDTNDISRLRAIAFGGATVAKQVPLRDWKTAYSLSPKWREGASMVKEGMSASLILVQLILVRVTTIWERWSWHETYNNQVLYRTNALTSEHLLQLYPSPFLL